MHQFLWKGNTWWLHPQKAMYWEETQVLLLSDVHLGKSGHFRKNGMAIPGQVVKNDMIRLMTLVQTLKPQKIVVVGDFFHSEDNEEHRLFTRWRRDLGVNSITLVKGNHDILDKAWYSDNGIEVVDELAWGSIRFQHHPPTLLQPSQTLGYVCGHVHPCVLLNTRLRQRLRFPCFHFNDSVCLLPAFGSFTGGHSVEIKSHSNVFAIINNEVIELPGK